MEWRRTPTTGPDESSIDHDDGKWRGGSWDCRGLRHGLQTTDSNSTAPPELAGNEWLTLVRTFLFIPEGGRPRTINGTAIHSGDKERLDYVIRVIGVMTRQTHR